jgi:hypothetical protein
MERIMPTLTDFLNRFRLPEFLTVLAIILTIVGIHEWRNVMRLFTNGTKKKKEDRN